MEGKTVSYNIKTMTVTELESVAYKMICEIKNIEHNLIIVEQEMKKRVEEGGKNERPNETT